MSGASKHWRSTRNVQHYKYTNILGMDDNVGYRILRVTRDQPWKGYSIGNLIFNAILALGFEWGIGLQSIEFSKILRGGSEREIALLQVREFSAKAGPADGQGLRRVPGADRVIAGGNLQIDAESQRGGQCDPQHLGQRGDLLWAFPRWC